MTDEYSIKQNLVELDNGIPRYEYKLFNKFNILVGVFYNEKIAKTVIEKLNEVKR